MSRGLDQFRQRCPDCGTAAGQAHDINCDVERCSVCGGQHLMCGHRGHDRAFARWTGWWPGHLETEAMGITLNDLYTNGMHKTLFAKPKVNN